MFVIADIEWVTNEAGHHSPTQLAAVKVDENWNEVSSIGTLIRPRDGQFHDWKHVAYTGASASDFLHARNAHNALSYFDGWLDEDDTILWWYSESEAIFNQLFKLILKKPNSHKSVCVSEYIYEHLYGEANSRGSSYKIAQARGIDVKAELNHYSINDIRVIRLLLSRIKYPQALLNKPLVKKEKPKRIVTSNYNYVYLYDDKTNEIHRKGCPLISNERELTQGYINLNTPIRKGYKPCACCKEEYQIAFREKNQDTINRTQYTYLYAPGSKVFHRYTCSLMLNAKSILGTRTYDNPAIQSRTPCKLCQPTPNDVYRPIPKETLVKRLLQKKLPSVPREEAVAISRQRTAASERNELLKNTLSAQERDDVFTLTQPRFAFFVATGYKTFHVRSCTKMQGLTMLKGFGKYQDAIKAGYTPCKKCKPTAKMDIKVSIPITNKVRADEKVEDLEVLCNEAGFSYNKDGNLFYLNTNVGKWIIELETAPVRLQHINLAVTPGETTYHKQPRVFLSYVDVFDYIKRHDEKLMKEKEEGIVFAKLFSENEGE